MTDHPITPPPELVQQWINQWHQAQVKHVELEDFVATQAARWGADQELEACCEWLALNLPGYAACDRRLRAARRPKPPSLREQALAKTDAILNDTNRILLVEVRETLELNRRALEALDD